MAPAGSATGGSSTTSSSRPHEETVRASGGAGLARAAKDRSFRTEAFSFQAVSTRLDQFLGQGSSVFKGLEEGLDSGPVSRVRLGLFFPGRRTGQAVLAPGRSAGCERSSGGFVGKAGFSRRDLVAEAFGQNPTELGSSGAEPTTARAGRQGLRRRQSGREQRYRRRPVLQPTYRVPHRQVAIVSRRMPSAFGASSSTGWKRAASRTHASSRTFSA